MTVKDAVRVAKEYVRDLYSDETIANLGLEEVAFDNEANQWLITLGFSRPWDRPANTFAALTDLRPTSRTYKVVEVDTTGKVTAVRVRETAA